jgi:hypothetical protein
VPQQRRNPKRESHGSGAVRREALRRKRERQALRRKLRLPGAIGAVVVIAVVLLLVSRSGSSSGKAPEGAASTFGANVVAATDSTIDGIPCEAGEKLTYHVHSHLAVGVNGVQETIPQGIGINTTKGCIYWLHSHTPDGIVHIEAPSEQAFTLGQYFDVWGQPLSATQVASAQGTVTAYVDGQAYTGDPRSIPLGNHTVIQLDVGSGNPGAQSYTFPSSP